MKIAAWAGGMALIAGMATAAEKKSAMETSIDMAKPHAITTEAYLDSAVEFAKNAYTAADMDRPQKDVIDANWKELKDAVNAAEQHSMHVSQMLPPEKKEDVAANLREFRSELDQVKMTLKKELRDPREAKMTLSQVYPHLTAARDRFNEVADNLDAMSKEPPAVQMERGMPGKSK